MSTGTIAIVSGLGTGSSVIAGMGAVDGVEKLVAAAKALSPEPSTTVTISEAGRALRAADGVQPGASIGELAEALIVALLLQLLENKKNS